MPSSRTRDLSSNGFKRSVKAVDVLTSAEALAELRPGGTIVLDRNRPPVKSRGLRFTVVRPADLLALDVVATGLTHAEKDGVPVLQAAEGKAGVLAIRLAYQHTGEEATPEANGVDQGPSLTPVRARAARRSRIVLEVPAGTHVDYSTEGLLAAMSRLQMRVVPLATPRTTMWQIPPILMPIVVTPGGVSLFDLDGQYVVAKGKVTTGKRPIKTLIGEARALREATGRLSVTAATDLRAAGNRRIGVDIAAGRRIVGIGDLTISPIKPGAIRVTVPRAPRDDETAIEAPFRLTLSPSKLGGWTHALAPVSAPDDAGRVELWHSRLGVRSSGAADNIHIDERPNPQRIVRAVWAREMELKKRPSANEADPFLGSLDGGDRITLVGLTTQPNGGKPATPVNANQLMLSSLGAWLNVDGAWAPGTGKTLKLPKDISLWKHIAPMGRDQFVRVEYPGYIFPFGHEAILVKITERKIKSATNPQARLYQRQFIIVSEPVKRYTQRDMPFSEVRIAPVVTPDLDFPLDRPSPPGNDFLFWPKISGQRFRWKLHTLDRDGNHADFETPLLFVSRMLTNKTQAVNAYKAENVIDGRSQQIAFAASSNPGDTISETQSIKMDGSFSGDIPVPRMAGAQIVIPAMRHLTPSAPATAVKYPDFYINGGFGGSGNPGDVFLTLDSPTEVQFASTERSGGFVKPNIGLAALSRVTGLAGDVDSVRAGSFDPISFLGDAAPKLFGLVNLVELLVPNVPLDLAPKFLSEALDGVSALLADLAQFRAAVAALPGLAAQVAARVDAVEAAIADMLDADGVDAATVEAALSGELNALKALITQARDAAIADAVAIGPVVRARIERLTGTLAAALETVAPLIEKILSFVNGLDPGDLSFRAHLDWRPKIRHWPDNPDTAIFRPARDDVLLLSIDVRASGGGEAGVDILAEITDFTLQLLPGQPLMRFNFDRLAFRAGTSRKPEVDIVFGGIEFIGLLSFIDGLRSLIPLDGFSDPPFLDVSAEGVTAGFTIALPNLAVGIFSLTNISLGADARIPFLGESPVDVGFNFCTRERPFTIAVAFLGGGGFFGLRASPRRLELLEMALEFGAIIAIDLGVASGSVSAMGGVYLRLEGDAGTLTGYFRIRGEVSVLAIVSVSVELYMALSYEFGSGKMVGQASITVCVEVLFISKSVKISCERRFAGSNGDPTVAEMLAVSPDGGSLVWDEYCSAFAGA